MVATRRDLAIAVGVFVSSLSQPRGVRADEPDDDGSNAHEELIRVDYEVPEGCPSQEEYLRQVREEYGIRFRVVGEDGPEARLFWVHVELHASESTFAGVLYVIDSMGKDETRVERPDCAETVEYLVVHTAMALGVVAPDDEDDPPPIREPETVGSSWVGARSSVALGMAPDTAAAFSLHGGYDFRAPPWRPSLALRVTRGGWELPIEERDAEFTWLLAEVDGCMAPWRRLAGTKLMLCVTLNAGGLRVRSEVMDVPFDAWRPWLALGAMGQAQWVIADHWLVALDAGVRAPLVRDRFFVPPGMTIHEVPLLVFEAGLATGAVF